MTLKNQPNRIPAEEAGSFQTWHLPPVGAKGAVLPSAEKEAKETEAEVRQQSAESIEDIDLPPGVPNTGMTAQEMQEIFDEAERDGFAQGHKDGYDKGMTEGMAEGYEAGQQKGLMEMRQQLVAEQQRFQKLADALLQPLRAQDDDIEKMLLDIVSTLTQSVVQRELTTDSSHIVELVKAAVDVLPVGSSNLRICLNPDDLVAVETYAEEQQLDWRFFGDVQLSPGGCRVEAPNSRVNFSVANRLKTVLEQFVNKQLTDADDDLDSDADSDADSGAERGTVRNDYQSNHYENSDHQNRDHQNKPQIDNSASVESGVAPDDLTP
jgi:flagellar assembly protein FliH